VENRTALNAASHSTTVRDGNRLSHRRVHLHLPLLATIAIAPPVARRHRLSSWAGARLSLPQRMLNLPFASFLRLPRQAAFLVQGAVHSLKLVPFGLGVRGSGTWAFWRILGEFADQSFDAAEGRSVVEINAHA